MLLPKPEPAHQMPPSAKGMARRSMLSTPVQRVRREVVPDHGWPTRHHVPPLHHQQLEVQLGPWGTEGICQVPLVPDPSGPTPRLPPWWDGLAHWIHETDVASCSVGEGSSVRTNPSCGHAIGSPCVQPCSCCCSREFWLPTQLLPLQLWREIGAQGGLGSSLHRLLRTRPLPNLWPRLAIFHASPTVRNDLLRFFQHVRCLSLACVPRSLDQALKRVSKLGDLVLCCLALVLLRFVVMRRFTIVGRFVRCCRSSCGLVGDVGLYVTWLSCEFVPCLCCNRLLRFRYLTLLFARSLSCPIVAFVSCLLPLAIN